MGSLGGGDDSKMNIDLSIIKDKTHKRTPTFDEENMQNSSRKIKALVKSEGSTSSKGSKSSPNKKTLDLIKQSFQRQITKKIEIPLLFQNIKEFVRFLTRQLENRGSSISNTIEDRSSQAQNSFQGLNSFGALLMSLKQAKDTIQNNNQANQTEYPVVPLILEMPDFDSKTIRQEQDLSDVKQKKFGEKYLKFLSINDQNLQQLIRKQKVLQEENQNGMQQTQDMAQEDKHMGETHNFSKAEMQKRVLKSKSKPQQRKRFVTLYDTKMGQLKNSVANQVNYDKCMYSKLLTFERQESTFVAKFLRQFEEVKGKIQGGQENQNINQIQPPQMSLTEKKLSKKETINTITTATLNKTLQKPPIQQKPRHSILHVDKKSGLNLSQKLASKQSIPTNIAQGFVSSAIQKISIPLNRAQSAQSAKKPPKILLTNLSIDKINTKETLNEIKNLIKRSQSASSNRSLEQQKAAWITQLTTPKSYSLNQDLKHFNLNQSSQSAQKLGQNIDVKNSTLSTSFQSNNLLQNFANKLNRDLNKSNQMNKSAIQFNPIKKLLK
eukprot:403368037